MFLLLEVCELSTAQLSSSGIGADRHCVRTGGTAGCILASRLSQADPSLSILVVEGGKNNFNDPTVTNPAVFLSHLAPDSKSAIFYQGRKSDKLGGRAPIVPAGGILGGGSSINFMM
jgi:alcohol oxidase